MNILVVLAVAVVFGVLRFTRSNLLVWAFAWWAGIYVLIFIAVTFTWLMGLMGYVRSGLRQHWHVYDIMCDRSPDAFTPTLGFATKVVSVTVLLFFLLIGAVFWIASLHDRPDFGSEGGNHS